MRRNSKRANDKSTSNQRRGSKSKSNYGAKDKTISKKEIAESENEVTWYSADPALLRDAASFPFSWPTGASDTHDLTLYDSSHVQPYSKVPGIVTMYVTPSLGHTSKATDPINVAAQSIYSFVRHANSGHSNYDAPDLMLYILAMANCYSYLIWCERLYGYALTYDQRNRYIPNELIRLNGVNPDDLRDHLADFRFWINTFIAKMASFAVPNTLSIFSRMTFLYSDYYVEGTSIKEQLYQLAPEGFYKFGLDNDDKGQLIWTPFSRSTLANVQDVIDYGNNLFGAVWDQEDFGIMSGDILKAYGDRIIKLMSVPEAYVIAPKFDPVVLTQLKNATMCEVAGTNITQTAVNPISMIITQSVKPRAYTTSDTFWGTTTAFNSGDVTIMNALKTRLLKDWKTLTVDTNEPTPDVVMEATRLMYGYDAVADAIKVGSELITRLVITWDIGQDYEYKQMNALAVGVPSSVVAVIDANQMFKHFHYLPRVFWAIEYNSGNSVQASEVFDLDNFAVLNNADMMKIHQAAVINMYAVPSIGKVQ